MLLSELELDGLNEIFNVGVGSAATLMSQMINEEITLNVPEIVFLSREEAGERIAKGDFSQVCSVSQRFKGSFQGEALVMFPESKSLDLVRLMVGRTLPLESLSELEEDALNEVGNIILTSCLSTLADMLKTPIDCDLPVLSYVPGKESFSKAKIDDQVLFLHIQFDVEKHHIQGYLCFLLNVEALGNLKQSLVQFLSQISQ